MNMLASFTLNGENAFCIYSYSYIATYIMYTWKDILSIIFQLSYFLVPHIVNHVFNIFKCKICSYSYSEYMVSNGNINFKCSY